MEEETIAQKTLHSISFKDEDQKLDLFIKNNIQQIQSSKYFSIRITKR